jgi:hypothetical protein
MIKVGYAIILSLVIFSSSVTYANSTMGDLVTTAWPLKDSLEEGDFPIIVGNVKDQAGKPVSDAKVKIAFASESVSSVTNNVGSFYIESKTPAKAGDYAVNVISTKEGYGMSIVSTTFFVNGIPQFIPEVDFDVVNQVPILIHDGLTKNPLSQIILQHMETIQKQQEEAAKKQQKLLERKNFIETQRQMAKNSLNEELKSFEKQTEFNSPRLAFERFVQSVDDTVQFVFWGQFNLTEQKHNEAFAAKMEALANGENSTTATKVFQRKAAISKSEIVALNSDLNVKYGLADKTTQSYFDNEGKLRWNENSATNKTVTWYLPPK